MGILLLMLFNGFILFVAMDLVVTTLHRVTHYQIFLLIILSAAIVCGLVFLFHSVAGQWFLRFMSGARKPIPREEEKLNPIIYHVQSEIQTHLGLKLLPIKLRITDDPLPNASAIGKETLVISRGLYETTSEEELASIIAHEFGHLHNGDSTKLGIALGVSFISLTIAWIASVIANIIGGISRGINSSNHESGWIIGLFAFGLSLFTWFFLLFVKGGNWLLKLIMLFIGRKQEYKADQFAIQAGFGAGLLSYLDKIKNMQFDSPKSLLGRLNETHPPTMLRIGEVEKILQR